MGKRSIKLDGNTTSVFLEDAFWKELETRADERGKSWSQYMRELLDNSEHQANRSAAVKEVLIQELRNDYEELRKTLSVNNKAWETQPQVSNPQSRWLVEENGIRRRVEFNRGKLCVGRHAKNDIVLSDAAIESRHLLLAFDGDRWWAIDLNSQAGTLLNNRPISVTPIPRRGELSIGDCQIIRV